ncbi:MAG: cysteine--tRNA ligase [Cryomorphaceae bacterium BACL7 MAG-120322-bin74]|jgi:cysteinyl-tRNA synthetase|nr:MAG: cysteine--tRNA ligase [Cryomorphaceae bacterium BACL7 MAG-120322-bin74]KRO82705.1 MAG: cysteine--tRNA ligase [Cryomorphaceae bacterium BACL7 MAG-121220-bin83]NQW25098.1 cysteine--tRNA ligase [Cryomorphaceae bacterium]
MSQLQIYDSHQGALKTFTPLKEGHAGLYVCGPTVYSHVHLGNVRTFLSFDMVFRYLQFLGYKVRYVRNITDAGHLIDDADEGEDKVGRRAKLEQVEPMEIAQRYTVNFHDVMRAFNTLPPSIEPTATGHIVEQISMTQQLLENGWAYEANGSIYFDVDAYSKVHPYGELSGRNLDEMRSGTRELDGQTDKRSPIDFALWKKASEAHIMRWASPWGEGFPGWHLECSAMSTKYLGTSFDIHGGGMDLKFPHHECEIAQNKGANQDGGAQVWMHANMLTLNGKRMSKSTGNTLLPDELLSGDSPHLSKAYPASVARFFIHQAHYRSVLDFSDEALQAAEKGYQRLIHAWKALSERPGEGPSKGSFDVDHWQAQCVAAMNNDFNSPILIAHLFDAVKAIQADQQDRSLLGQSGAKVLLQHLNAWIFDVLGLQDQMRHAHAGSQKALDAAMGIVLQARKQARDQKDWSTSDAIRDQLAAGGIQVKDGTDGSTYTIGE